MMVQAIRPRAEEAPMLYRPMQPGDVEPILALGAAEFGSSSEYSWDWSAKEVAQYLDSSFGVGLVCTRNDDIVAFALAQRHYSQQKPDVAWFRYILVHPGHQRRGIGRRLFEQSLRALRAQGATEVVTDVYETNTESLNFFSREGFDVKERWFILAKPLGD
jgi:ribosomal protein S18 acetylase RimI-like enzyme